MRESRFNLYRDQHGDWVSALISCAIDSCERCHNSAKHCGCLPTDEQIQMLKERYAIVASTFTGKVSPSQEREAKTCLRCGNLGHNMITCEKAPIDRLLGTEVKRMYEEGAPIESIIEQLGISNWSKCYRILRAMGTTLNRRAGRRQVQPDALPLLIKTPTLPTE